MSAKSRMRQKPPQRCSRCGQPMRGDGDGWICVIEKADPDGYGVVTELLCPQCQTPIETAESSVNDVLCQYVWRDGRVAVKPKPQEPQRSSA
jgi:hypothetical protein